MAKAKTADESPQTRTITYEELTDVQAAYYDRLPEEGGFREAYLEHLPLPKGPKIDKEALIGKLDRVDGVISGIVSTLELRRSAIADAKVAIEAGTPTRVKELLSPPTVSGALLSFSRPSKNGSE